ncbi:RNA-binding protein [Candidatus Woesearchaeota archaeon]|nr:RNA-binding protein [Candidatus Woesearchaeota archaeon]
MSQLLVQEKEIVVPGETIAEGMDYIPSKGMYRSGEQVKSAHVGLVYIEGKVLKLVPLSGRYLPKRGDSVIAKVTDITMNGWIMDINSAYSAMLPLKDATPEYVEKGADLTKYFTFGDLVFCKISNVTSQNLVDLSLRGPGLRKLNGGRALKIAPSKVPRLVGKQGSMVSMIKKYTQCQIIVGQNGLVWLQGEPEQELLTIDTIRLVEQRSHLSGLTDYISNYLAEKCGPLSDEQHNEQVNDDVQETI